MTDRKDPVDRGAPRRPRPVGVGLQFERQKPLSPFHFARACIPEIQYEHKKVIHFPLAGHPRLGLHLGIDTCPEPAAREWSAERMDRIPGRSCPA